MRNLDSHGNYDPAGHGRNADGIAVKFGSATGNRITWARLYNSDDGLDLWQFSSPVTVEWGAAPSRATATGSSWAAGASRWPSTTFLTSGSTTIGTTMD